MSTLPGLGLRVQGVGTGPSVRTFWLRNYDSESTRLGVRLQRVSLNSIYPEPLQLLLCWLFLWLQGKCRIIWSIGFCWVQVSSPTCRFVRCMSLLCCAERAESVLKSHLARKRVFTASTDAVLSFSQPGAILVHGKTSPSHLSQRP